MPAYSHDSDRQLSAFWQFALEAISEGRAAITGAGVAVSLLGVLYIFSFVSRLHFVHILDDIGINVMTAACSGAVAAAFARAYLVHLKK